MTEFDETISVAIPLFEAGDKTFTHRESVNVNGKFLKSEEESVEGLRGSL